MPIRFAFYTSVGQQARQRSVTGHRVGRRHPTIARPLPDTSWIRERQRPMSESHQEPITASHRPPPPPIPSEVRPGAPHRGPLIMILGMMVIVVGGIGLILGPIAWIMGRNDLREMDAGRMDSSGRGNTNAGRICGMIATLIHGTGAVTCLGYFIFMGAMFTSIVGAAAKSQAHLQKAQADAAKPMNQPKAAKKQMPVIAEKAAPAPQIEDWRGPGAPPKFPNPAAHPAPPPRPPNPQTKPPLPTQTP